MLTPDWWSRKEYAVLKAVEVFGTVRGRHMLNRILYFANLKTGTYKYQWHRGGPLSGELECKVADHVFYTSLSAAGGDPEGELSLSAVGGRLLGYGPHPEIDSALAWARGLLGGMPPRELELASSVHYLFACGHERGAIHGFMSSLDPETGFTAGDVERALAFLEGGGLLEPELAVPGFPQTPAVRQLQAGLKQSPQIRA